MSGEGETVGFSPFQQTEHRELRVQAEFGTIYTPSGLRLCKGLATRCGALSLWCVALYG